MKKGFFFVLFLNILLDVFSQDTPYFTQLNIPYYSISISQNNDYMKESCVLDIYYPINIKGFATIVWFHGGSLTGGSKELPEALKNKGLCIIGVNYRLSPKVSAPKYIEDAAAAVAWTFKHINKLGGDSSLIFVSGHSAGGYLTTMIGLDKKWLKVYDVDANQIAGLIPLSGQMITHFTIRKERGLEETKPVIDELAPLYHVRADAPPLLMITGDREMEMLGRYEENAYLFRMMKLVGHKKSKLFELEGYGHNMTEPAFPLVIKEVQDIVKEKKH